MKTEGPNRALCKRHRLPALGPSFRRKKRGRRKRRKGEEAMYELHDYPFAWFHFGLRNQNQFLFVPKEPLLADSVVQGSFGFGPQLPMECRRGSQGLCRGPSRNPRYCSESFMASSHGCLSGICSSFPYREASPQGLTPSVYLETL